jgi:predicted Zn-dependent protease
MAEPKKQDAAGSHEPLRLRVGVLIAHSPSAEPEGLKRLVDKALKTVDDEIEQTTGVRWVFKVAVPQVLEEGVAHNVSDFLDPAMNLMAEGLFDLVVVVTDVPISGPDKTLVFGSFSKTARVAVVSTRKFLEGPDAEEKRTLESKTVVDNLTVLLLHVMGHIMGVVHQWSRGNVMAPFRLETDRGEIRYGQLVRKKFKKKARKLPDQKVEIAGALMSFVFHSVAFFRNFFEIVVPVLKGRAFRIPLAMTSMATAALIPTLVLVFTAEIWDTAFHMSSVVAAAFAIATILLGSVYLGLVHNLYFPRKEKETITEHAAVVNWVVFFSLIQALIGLFVVVGVFVWLLESYVFPSTLMSKWTGFEDGQPIRLVEKIRLAVFVSTLATMTAALAGGLDNREIVRHFALFSDRP